MDVIERADDLAAHMASQLRLRGGSLADVADRAGRRLPKHLRQEIDVIVEAEAMSENPKMARLVDHKRLVRAERRIRRFLDKQNPGAERLAAFLDRLAAVTFVAFAIVLAVFFLLLSRGHFG